LLRDVDTGERTVEYSLQKQLKSPARGSIERALSLVCDWILNT